MPPDPPHEHDERADAGRTDAAPRASGTPRASDTAPPASDTPRVRDAARLRLALGVTAGAVLCVAALAFCSARDEGARDVRPARALPVETFRARESSEYSVRELYAGRIVSRRASDLGFERPGRITEVLYDEGARVEKNAVLARLDTRELRGRQRELRAQRDAILAQLALARATATRRRQLFEAGHLSPQQLDESEYGETRLAAQRDAAEAALEQIEVQLELSQLRAPFDGVLAARFADEGAVLPGGAPVLRLLEDGVLELHLGVPPELAARLQPGSEHLVEITNTRPGAAPELEAPPARATLHAILPTVASDTRTVTAVLRLTGATTQLRHGALARVAFQNRIVSAGFWLPLTALAEGHRGLWTTYVAQPDDAGVFHAERRQLEVIHAESDRAFVRGTLREGDRIVTGGAHRLTPGIPVTPVAARHTGETPAPLAPDKARPGAAPVDATPDPRQQNATPPGPVAQQQTPQKNRAQKPAARAKDDAANVKDTADTELVEDPTHAHENATDAEPAADVKNAKGAEGAANTKGAANAGLATDAKNAKSAADAEPAADVKSAKGAEGAANAGLATDAEPAADVKSVKGSEGAEGAARGREDSAQQDAAKRDAVKQSAGR